MASLTNIQTTTLLDRARWLYQERADDVAVTLIEHDGDKTVTYGEFLAQAARYAHALEAVGVNPAEDRETADAVLRVADGPHLVCDCDGENVVIGDMDQLGRLVRNLLDNAVRYSPAGSPIVVSLVAGVFLAFFVTLMLVPALYAIGLDITAFRARVRQRMRAIWSPKSAGEDLAADRSR